MTRQEVERREKWNEVVFGEADSQKLLLLDFATDGADRPPLHPDKTAERIEWAWRKYEAQQERIEWLDDDRVPYLDCLTGTEIFAAAFGCEVYYPDDTNPFAKPLVDSPEAADALAEPSLDAPTLAQAFEIADELTRRAGPEAVTRLPDIQSPMDIAGIVWDKNNFFISAVEAPDAVLRLAEKARSLLARFLDEWFSRYGRSFVAHYPDYYMDHGITLSEDEIGSVGPMVFDSLFLPELEFLSKRYDGIGIHCCAHAEHQWSGLKRVTGLHVLNLNQPREVLDRSFAYFSDSVVQLPIPSPWRPENGAADIPAESAMIFNVPVESVEAAKRAVEEFRRTWHR